MNKQVKFVVHIHEAKKAGKHFDMRFQKPGDMKNWLSFAVRKGVPTKPGTRVLAIKTHLHSEKEAMTVGEIPKGKYGAGTLKVFDEGTATVEKYSPAHIALTLKGKKLKGLYHLINIGVTRNQKYKANQYLLFKGGSLKKMNTIEAYLRKLSESVGKHRNVPDSNYDEKELQMGIEIEKEHTDSEEIAKQIAKDHLEECPDYYTRLKKLESNCEN